MQKYVKVGLLSTVGAIALTAFQLSSPVSSQMAQSSGGYPGDFYSPALDKALVYREARRYPEAIEELRVIAERNAGTELEATAIFLRATTLRSASFYPPPPAAPRPESEAADLRRQADAECQRLIQKFPNTKYSLWGLLHLSSNQGRSEQIVKGLGLPAFADVKSGRVSKVRESLIAEQYREIVSDIYSGLSGPDRPLDEQTRVLLFCRQSFPTGNSRGDFGQELRSLFQASSASDTEVKPVVRVVSPRANAPVCSKSATLHFETSDGDVNARQIDFHTCRIELDGLDIRSFCDISSKVSPRGRVFEKLKIVYRPTGHLAPGLHNYRILADTCGSERSTEVVIPFHVKPNCDGNDHGENNEDDHWEDND